MIILILLILFIPSINQIFLHGNHLTTESTLPQLTFSLEKTVVMQARAKETNLLLSTDKYYYGSQENISIYLSNEGPGTLHDNHAIGGTFSVRNNDTGELIYAEHDLDAVVADSRLRPHETTFVEKWNQRAGNGSLVPAGNYTIEKNYGGLDAACNIVIYPWVLKLVVDRKYYGPGEGVVIGTKNTSNETLMVGGIPMIGIFDIKSENGSLVYHEEHMEYAPAIWDMESGGIHYDHTWNQLDLDGNPVPPGRYFISEPRFNNQEDLVWFTIGPDLQPHKAVSEKEHYHYGETANLTILNTAPGVIEGYQPAGYALYHGNHSTIYSRQKGNGTYPYFALPPGGGFYLLEWNLSFPNGTLLPPGVYPFRVDFGRYNHTIGINVSGPPPDTRPPVLVGDLSQESATTGDNYEFIIDIEDESGIGSVNVNWSHDPLSGNITLNHTPYGTWRGNITLDTSPGMLFYNAIISDKAGNINSSYLGSIEVKDNDPPVFLIHELDGNTGTGETISLTVNFHDNHNISKAFIHFRTQGEDFLVDRMIYSRMIGAANVYIYQLEIPVEAALLEYYFSCIDIEGNRMKTADVSGVFSTLVMDMHPPTADAGNNQSAGMGDEIVLSGGGSIDNIGIVNYTWILNLLGKPKTLYGKEPVITFHDPGQYRVVLRVYDAIGNMDSDNIMITVGDTESPFVAARERMITTQGDVTYFSVNASGDNLGIVNWTWAFEYQNSTEMLYGREPFFIFHTTGEYSVKITVKDEAGNAGWDTFEVLVGARSDNPSDPEDNDDIGPGEKDEVMEKSFAGNIIVYIILGILVLAIIVWMGYQYLKGTRD